MKNQSIQSKSSKFKVNLLMFLLFNVICQSVYFAQPNEAIYFNGETSLIKFCNSCEELWDDSDFATDEFTISFWAKWIDLDQTETSMRWSNMVSMNRIAGSASGGGDNGVFWFQHNSNNTLFEFAVQTTEENRRFVRSTTEPIEGMWYHLTGVYDGSQIRIYVDGVEESSQSLTGVMNYESGVHTALLLGRWAFDATRNFNGGLGELKMWRRVLTPSEIQTQMHNSPDLTDSDLLMYLTLDDPDNVHDLSPFNLSPSDTVDISPLSNALLPVELLYFRVVNQQKGNLLEWSTATELNNNYYIVERSTDGLHWNEIEIIHGAGTTNEEQSYSILDRNFESEINYYRLTQVDFDRAYEVFPVISIDNRDNVYLVKTVNLLGQEIPRDFKGIRIEIYSDGSKIKKGN